MPASFLRPSRWSLVFLLLCLPTTAHAFLMKMEIPVQAQLHLQGRLVPEVDGWAGEIGGSLTFVGFTASVGLGMETATQGDANGGYLRLEGQIRPLYFTFQPNAYLWFDPYLLVGLDLGGMQSQKDVVFRGVFAVGAGADVGIPFSQQRTSWYQVVLKIRYQYVLLQSPALATHRLWFGLGIRFAGI